MSRRSSQSKKGKLPDTRPARKRYWDSGRLQKRKIKRLMARGKTRAEAQAIWEARKHKPGG